MPNRFINNVTKRRAAFLDRDGVLNIDRGYVWKPDQVELVPGAVDAVKYLNDRNFFVVVVTNQSGIGRGLYSEQDFWSVMKVIQAKLSEKSARLDAIYFSPYHPTEALGEYRLDSECRKPKPGMILKAAKEHNLDLQTSILIGDQPRDLEAAEAAGVEGYQYDGRMPLDHFIIEELRLY